MIKSAKQVADTRMALVEVLLFLGAMVVSYSKSYGPCCSSYYYAAANKKRISKAIVLFELRSSTTVSGLWLE